MGEAAGSEVDPKADGMPLLGGKGGDGFGNSVPLLIAWDSSAGKKRTTHCKYSLTKHRRPRSELRSELSFQANYIIS